jgi:hypothetical protein
MAGLARLECDHRIDERNHENSEVCGVHCRRGVGGGLDRLHRHDSAGTGDKATLTLENFATDNRGNSALSITLSPGALGKDRSGHFVVDGSRTFIAAALKSSTGNQTYELSVPDYELATIHSASIYDNQARWPLVAPA